MFGAICDKASLIVQVICINKYWFNNKNELPQKSANDFTTECP